MFGPGNNKVYPDGGKQDKNKCEEDKLAYGMMRCKPGHRWKARAPMDRALVVMEWNVIEMYPWVQAYRKRPPSSQAQSGPHNRCTPQIGVHTLRSHLSEKPLKHTKNASLLDNCFSYLVCKTAYSRAIFIAAVHLLLLNANMLKTLSTGNVVPVTLE
jgi:hypothetical protein